MPVQKMFSSLNQFDEVNKSRKQFVIEMWKEHMSIKIQTKAVFFRYDWDRNNVNKAK